MKVFCFIQARTTSTRFPNKVNQDLGGVKIIDRVISQCKKMRGVFVLPLWAEMYPELDENDVLSRYAITAKETQADVIIRVTGDCPFFDPQIGELLLQYYRLGHYDYVSNVYPKRTFPDGLDCEVFSADMLRNAHTFAKTPHEREHVTPWIQERAAWYNLTLPVDWSWVRLTCDTPEDLVWLNTALRAPRNS